MRIPLLAALLLPSAAMAQTVPPPQAAPGAKQSEIVVTAKRTTDDEIADFVDAFTPGPPRGQLARFEFAVCPMASGVDAAQKAALADRIRAVARAARVPVGKAGCKPNILVIVTPDKKALILALQHKDLDYFGDLRPREVRALADSPDPAVAWHIRGPLLGADGRALDVDPGGGFYVNRTTNQGSRIAFATRPQFAAAIVVIDSHALEGLSVNQVADYAAMRTLIQTDPSRLGTSSAPTILKVLGAPMGSPVPVTLTEWDLGVLSSFYAADPNLTAASQRSLMRKGLKKEVSRRN